MATFNKEDGRFNDLVSKMETEKKKWEKEALESEDGPDETDALLSKAIEMAISQGKGWKPGEREAYLENLMDDDYIHPMFATNQEELDKSGMAQAFSTLMHDEPPARLMVEKKKKGNEAFMNGKKNVAKNIQVRWIGWYAMKCRIRMKSMLSLSLFQTKQKFAPTVLS